MKVFTIMGCFRLPDDFKGTESEAMRLMADFHEKAEMGETPLGQVVLQGLYQGIPPSLWDRFLEAARTGSKILAEYSLGDISWECPSNELIEEYASICRAGFTGSLEDYKVYKATYGKFPKGGKLPDPDTIY